MVRISPLICLFTLSLAAQDFTPPRLPDGHPNLQGVWMTGQISAAFNLEAHAESFQLPAGPSVIVDPPDGKLPYLPEARRRAVLNFEQRDLDPVGYCHPHGVPRVMVPPFPMEIVQDGDYFTMLSETEHSVRVIPTDGRPHRKNYWAWMGDSRGHWEGFRMTGPDTILYEATITDPGAYSRPWTMRIPLKRQPKGTELIEYDCVEGERDLKHYRNLQKTRGKQ